MGTVPMPNHCFKFRERTTASSSRPLWSSPEMDRAGFEPTFRLCTLPEFHPACRLRAGRRVRVFRPRRRSMIQSTKSGSVVGLVAVHLESIMGLILHIQANSHEVTPRTSNADRQHCNACTISSRSFINSLSRFTASLTSPSSPRFINRSITSSVLFIVQYPLSSKQVLRHFSFCPVAKMISSTPATSQHLLSTHNTSPASSTRRINPSQPQARDRDNAGLLPLNHSYISWCHPTIPIVSIWTIFTVAPPLNSGIVLVARQ